LIDTTFQVRSLDRSRVKWEKHIFDLSPVEKHGDIWFKREDKFAPLGYGGINGSKLRVCIWLIDEAIKAGAKGVIHGAVTGSPQHPFVATICKHYGIPCVDVIGSEDIDGHKNLAIAREMGAKFEYSKIGYAKTLESKAFQLRESKYHDYFVLETNITVNENKNSPSRISKFHSVGSYQSYNIPDQIETVIIPAGSCNSCIGALLGIALKRPKNLKRIILMGIGNYGSKDPPYIQRRLQLIGAPDVFLFPWEREVFQFDDGERIQVIHHDVYKNPGTNKPYTEYSDLMPFNYHGIQMHSRYEGKCWNWIQDFAYLDDYLNDKSMFWIVGSEPA
jgi:hypothetical protein